MRRKAVAVVALFFAIGFLAPASSARASDEGMGWLFAGYGRQTLMAETILGEEEIRQEEQETEISDDLADPLQDPLPGNMGLIDDYERSLENDVSRTGEGPGLMMAAVAVLAVTALYFVWKRWRTSR